MLLKQLAKFLAGEEIEIPLPPGGTPSVALASGGFHFVVCKCQMNDKFSDARLKIFQRGLVEFSPLFRRDRRGDGDGVVEDDISGSQAGFQIRAVREPVARDKNRQVIFVSKPENDFEETFAIFIEPVLVGIEMRWTDTHGVSAFNLRAELQLNFVRIDFCGSRPVVMEITILVYQARNFVFRSDRTPAVVDTLAGEREVKAEINSGMRFGIVGNFREPRAGDHEAGGIDEAGVESFDRCGVYRMCYANVVGVDNQEFRIAGEAELFRKSLASVLRARIEKDAREQVEEHDPDAFSNHYQAFRALPVRLFDFDYYRTAFGTGLK